MSTQDNTERKKYLILIMAKHLYLLKLSKLLKRHDTTFPITLTQIVIPIQHTNNIKHSLKNTDRAPPSLNHQEETKRQKTRVIAKSHHPNFNKSQTRLFLFTINLIHSTYILFEWNSLICQTVSVERYTFS